MKKSQIIPLVIGLLVGCITTVAVMTLFNNKSNGNILDNSNTDESDFSKYVGTWTGSDDSSLYIFKDGTYIKTMTSQFTSGEYITSCTKGYINDDMLMADRGYSYYDFSNDENNHLKYDDALYKTYDEIPSDRFETSTSYSELYYFNDEAIQTTHYTGQNDYMTTQFRKVSR